MVTNILDIQGAIDKMSVSDLFELLQIKVKEQNTEAISVRPGSNHFLVGLLNFMEDILLGLRNLAVPNSYIYED